MKEKFEKLLCWLGIHDWDYSSKDNFTVMLRCCSRPGCVVKQKLFTGDSIGKTEYWFTL